MREDDGPSQTFVSVEELAERYGLSNATVHAWIYRGSAPRSYKIGKYRRFKLSDVLIWEEARATDDTSNP